MPGLTGEVAKKAGEANNAVLDKREKLSVKGGVEVVDGAGGSPWLRGPATGLVKAHGTELDG